jgi:hypothetical protein
MEGQQESVIYPFLEQKGEDRWMEVGVDLVQGIFSCKRSWLFWLLFPAAGHRPHFAACAYSCIHKIRLCIMLIDMIG